MACGLPLLMRLDSDKLLSKEAGILQYVPHWIYALTFVFSWSEWGSIWQVSAIDGFVSKKARMNPCFNAEVGWDKVTSELGKRYALRPSIWRFLSAAQLRMRGASALSLLVCSSKWQISQTRSWVFWQHDWRYLCDLEPKDFPNFWSYMCPSILENC